LLRDDEAGDGGLVSARGEPRATSTTDHLRCRAQHKHAESSLVGPERVVQASFEPPPDANPWLAFHSRGLSSADVEGRTYDMGQGDCQFNPPTTIDPGRRSPSPEEIPRLRATAAGAYARVRLR